MKFSLHINDGTKTVIQGSPVQIINYITKTYLQERTQTLEDKVSNIDKSEEEEILNQE